MARRYTQMGQISEGILKMREEGKTRREIWEHFGLNKRQLENFINRHNRKQKEMAYGIMPRKRGRPRKDETLSLHDTDRELKRLKMENELLRDFLHECGRGRS